MNIHWVKHQRWGFSYQQLGNIPYWLAPCLKWQWVYHRSFAAENPWILCRILGEFRREKLGELVMFGAEARSRLLACPGSGRNVRFLRRLNMESSGFSVFHLHLNFHVYIWLYVGLKMFFFFNHGFSDLNHLQSRFICYFFFTRWSIYI